VNINGNNQVFVRALKICYLAFWLFRPASIKRKYYFSFKRKNKKRKINKNNLENLNRKCMIQNN